MKQATKPDGTKYWSYIIVYVDDILCIDHDSKSKMKYLGANIKQWNLQDKNGEYSKCYALSSESYGKEAVRFFEFLMLKHNLKYTSTRRYGNKTPLSSSDYRP